MATDKQLLSLFKFLLRSQHIALRRNTMLWKKPTAVEISCGMEINMYGPGEDDERSGGDVF